MNVDFERKRPEMRRWHVSIAFAIASDCMTGFHRRINLPVQLSRLWPPAVLETSSQQNRWQPSPRAIGVDDTWDRLNSSFNVYRRRIPASTDQTVLDGLGRVLINSAG
jgi:hypothetical protein